MVIEEKIPKIDTGQRDKDHDNRDRERDWNYQNNHHINNNHTQSNLINHTSHVSLQHFYWFHLVFSIERLHFILLTDKDSPLLSLRTEIL